MRCMPYDARKLDKIYYPVLSATKAYKTLFIH